MLPDYKVYQGWGLQRSCPTDPLKENDRKFAPTAPVASKFRLGNTQQFCFPFVISSVILLQDAFALRANQRLSISATFPIWSHWQNLGLNSTLPRVRKYAKFGIFYVKIDGDDDGDVGGGGGDSDDDDGDDDDDES